MSAEPPQHWKQWVLQSSRAMTSPCGKIRIPLNEGADDRSQIEEFIQQYNAKAISKPCSSASELGQIRNGII
jgi:hypothetical protein